MNADAAQRFNHYGTESISVSLTLANDPYQRRLPAALLRRGMLRQVLRLGPELEVLEPRNAGALEVVGRFPQWKIVRTGSYGQHGAGFQEQGVRTYRWPPVAGLRIGGRQDASSQA